jgi:hypothetical protein
VTVVPAQWVEGVDGPSVEAAFDTLHTGQVVVKSQVGACSWRQALLRRGEKLPPAEELPPAGALIQPFLPSATEEGEYSLLFFNRVYSHCAQKLPRDGDYRVQSVFGGTEHVHHPSSKTLAVAQSVVDAVDGPLLYARVDLMRLPDGRLALMELEVVEPYPIRSRVQTWAKPSPGRCPECYRGRRSSSHYGIFVTRYECGQRYLWTGRNLNDSFWRVYYRRRRQ